MKKTGRKSTNVEHATPFTAAQMASVKQAGFDPKGLPSAGVLKKGKTIREVAAENKVVRENAKALGTDKQIEAMERLTKEAEKRPNPRKAPRNPFDKARR